MALTYADVDSVAAQFVSARRAANALGAYPGALPQSLEAAYAIQDAAIALHSAPVRGWKVGRILPPLSDTLGVNRLCGPIFADQILLPAAGECAEGRTFPGGFGAAEAEFLFELKPQPALKPGRISLEDAANAVARVCIGIEIASSPLPTINDLGPLVTISDFGNNNGLIVGAEIADWQQAGFADWDVALDIDGTTAGTGRASAFPDGPIGSVRFLLEALAARGITIPAGTWVSSGAVTGVHKVTAGQSVLAFFNKNKTIGCRIANAIAA